MVAAICQQLNGLPLAIELAAARVNHLSPGALRERLERPLSAQLALLTGGARDQPARFRTMRDAIAWSYDLLDGAEQTLLQYLSAFPAGFTLAGAEHVAEASRGVEEKTARRHDATTAECPSPVSDLLSPHHPITPSPSVLDLLASLVAKSLVQYEGDWDGEPCYGMLKTIREFGRDQLAAHGQVAAARQRHAAWALVVAERSGPRVRGPDAARWLEVLEWNHASVRAALAWLAEQRNGRLLARLAGALCPFWEERAHYGEGRRWLEAALAVGAEAAGSDRLRLLTGAGTMAWHQADFAQATLRHEQALALARELSDREAEAFALNNLGVQASCVGEFDQARNRFEASLAIARELDTAHAVIRALHNLAQVQRLQLDSDAAMRSMEEVLALARARDMDWVLPNILAGLGLAATDLGEFTRAHALLQESLSLAVAKGNEGNVVDGLECVARLAAVTNQAEQATRLFGAGEALREHLDFPLSPSDRAYAEPIHERLREALGKDGFTAAWAEGRSLSQDAALADALALRVEHPARVAPQTGRPSTPHGLSERELDVLRLLAAGHSNREIGEALFISPATAARHVANIYNKLDVDSRAAATAFAHQHGLV